MVDVIMRVADFWAEYKVVGVVGLAVLVIFVCGSLLVEGNSRRVEEVPTWPVVRARIVEADNRTLADRDYSGFAVKWAVSLKLQYELDGREYTVPYKKVFYVTERVDFAKVLAAGEDVEIRYAPGNPEKVSLYPLIVD